jgi:hypothetical protein
MRKSRGIGSGRKRSRACRKARKRKRVPTKLTRMPAK